MGSVITERVLTSTGLILTVDWINDKLDDDWDDESLRLAIDWLEEFCFKLCVSIIGFLFFGLSIEHRDNVDLDVCVFFISPRISFFFSGSKVSFIICEPVKLSFLNVFFFNGFSFSCCSCSEWIHVPVFTRYWLYLWHNKQSHLFLLLFSCVTWQLWHTL